MKWFLTEKSIYVNDNPYDKSCWELSNTYNRRELVRHYNKNRYSLYEAKRMFEIEMRKYEHKILR